LFRKFEKQIGVGYILRFRCFIETSCILFNLVISRSSMTTQNFPILSCYQVLYLTKMHTKLPQVILLFHSVWLF